MRLLYLVAALTIVICVALCALVSMMLSRQLFEPVRELNAAMGAVEEGNLDTRIDVRSTDELGQLAGRFNRMTERLGSAPGGVRPPPPGKLSDAADTHDARRTSTRISSTTQPSTP